MILVSQNTVFAGWYISEKQEDKHGNLSFQSVFIEGQKIRIEKLESVLIVDLENEIVSMIFSTKMVFWQGNTDSLKKELFNYLQEKIEMVILQLPESEREEARIEFEKELHLMTGSQQKSIQPKLAFVEKESETKQLLNYTVSNFDFYCDSAFVESFWVTDQADPFSTIDRKRLNDMLNLFAPPSFLAFCRETKEYQDFMKGKYIMKSVNSTPYGDVVLEVTQFREVEIPTEFFAPPQNYRSISTGELIPFILNENDNLPNPAEFKIEDSIFDD